jgi:hypothetical protein
LTPFSGSIQWTARVGREHGFSEAQHSIEVFDTGEACTGISRLAAR